MIDLKKFLIKTHFYLLNLIPDHAFLSFIRRIFLVFFFLLLFFRVSKDASVQTDASKSLSSSPMDSETEERQESDMVELENSIKNDAKGGAEEEEEDHEFSKLVFKFSYQTETFGRLIREGFRDSDGDGDGDGSFRCSSPLASTADKYETFTAKNLSYVVEEPKAATLRLEESLCEYVNDAVKDNDFLQEKLVDGETEEAESGKDKREDSVSVETKRSEKLDEEGNFYFPEKIRFLVENDFLENTDSDSGMIDSSQTFTSHDEGFLTDSDFEEYFGSETSPEKESMEHTYNNGKNQDEDEDDDDDDDDSNGLESLWEHQDLIEQLQMELKKVKAIGLPTIKEEEDECPKIVEDLKPWKIEEKRFQHVDTISELHKFYKSYRERMRKFDILNYQKMYALGLLQSKDPLQANSTVGSSSTPAYSSVFPVSLRLWKQKKPETDPMVKFIREINGELEHVYVGQMCLSWEILHWQYEKAIELWESDVYGIRRYNEVAGEFQQFQVLVQRFMENEPFEGPRVQHYVKKRCVLRNLLQIPVIREDAKKDKGKGRRRDLEDGIKDDAITSEQLVEIMEESIRLFWRFVRSDKCTNSIHHKPRIRSQIEPEDFEELDMFGDIKMNLQKKEKILKDVLKSGKCVIRRLKRNKEEESSSSEDKVLHFFSQVDMKLVTRVLNMSKLTKDHLVWCHNKLSKINFVNRKIHFDPCFCLFPC